MRCVHLAVALSLFAVTSCGGSSSSPGAPSVSRPAASASPGVTGIAASATGGPSIFGAPLTDFARCLSGATDAACFAGARPVVGVITAGAAAPGAPGDLRAAIDHATVNLIWKPPTTGGPPVSYVLEAGSASGLSNLAVLSISDGRTSFTASNVANGTYYVRVKAQNAAGTSPPSNEVTVIVNAVTCQGPPLSPSGLASSVNGTTVTLTWIGPSGPPSNSPSTYIVEIGSAPFLSDLSISDLEGIATTMTANNVGAGKYVIRVRAKNACGTSGTSNEVVVNVVGAQGILAGTWLGTDRATRSNGQSAKLDLTFVVQHSGQTLVGAAAAIGFRFRVTQTEASSTVLTFAGTWTWGNSGQCAGQLAPGSITVDTTTNTMTGSFAGVNPDCLTETHDFTVTKQ